MQQRKTQRRHTLSPTYLLTTTPYFPTALVFGFGGTVVIRAYS
jgi:hypothetical protein